MRATIIALAALPLVACGGSGGGGVASIGSSAGSTGGTPTATPTPTPTATPTPTPIATPTPTAPSSSQANLFDVKTATTFDAIGAMHSLTRNDDGSSLYRGNASTVAAPSGTISYDPRDGIFVMSLSDAKAGVTRAITFQDPGHRTTGDTPGLDRQVPLLAGFNYLAVLDGEVPLTFFYQRPNTSGAFVSLAGFERNEGSVSEQGVFVFGSRSTALQTPTKGTARFNGQFLATMVMHQDGSIPVQQWLSGTSGVDVDFGKRSLTLGLSGTVGPAFFQDLPIANSALAIPSGSTFAANGSASWATSTAFAGTFASAGFSNGGTAVPIDFTAVSAGTTSAGASSIDGTFYGPDAKNIGGNFRIVGGIPNQRVDIMGGFVGGKQ